LCYWTTMHRRLPWTESFVFSVTMLWWLAAVEVVTDVVLGATAVLVAGLIPANSCTRSKMALQLCHITTVLQGIGCALLRSLVCHSYQWVSPSEHTEFIHPWLQTLFGSFSCLSPTEQEVGHCMRSIRGTFRQLELEWGWWEFQHLLETIMVFFILVCNFI